MEIIYGRIYTIERGLEKVENYRRAMVREGLARGGRDTHTGLAAGYL